MTKVNRIVVYEGHHCKIECGIREDGSEPAHALLTELQNRVWPDPEADELPDSYQVRTYTRLLAAIHDVANGDDPEPHMHNFLGDGMWEFKVNNLRLTYYDTNGAGESTTIGSEEEWRWDGSKHRMPEDFGTEGLVRLGHHFAKQTQKTSRRDLDEAFAVRREDFHHDRTQPD